MARYSEKQKAALDALMKDDVYNHAIEIIVEEGLGQLTMERIASEIGVSRGTLYNYFDDKDAVVDFVEVRVFEPVLAEVDAIADQKLGPAEKLRMIAEHVFDAVFENRALVVALIPNKLTKTTLECEVKRRLGAEGGVRKVILEGTDQGVFKDLPIQIVTDTYLGVISGMIEGMALLDTFKPAEEVVPTVMEIILGGLIKQQ